MIQPDDTQEVKYMRGLLNRISQMEEDMEKEKVRQYIFEIDVRRDLGAIQGIVLCILLIAVGLLVKQSGLWSYLFG